MALITSEISSVTRWILASLRVTLYFALAYKTNARMIGRLKKH
ncbi:hypothetical protein HanPSC8_Chr11g0457251 [Helianthus annuus]|nr:hypothetical protein HanPSC8_Chr11g0457251 [Helianthus annuus]